MPGGRLKAGKNAWIRSPKNYFLPIPILSAVFRGKVLQGLEQAFTLGRLSFSGSCIHLNVSFRQACVKARAGQG